VAVQADWMEKDLYTVLGVTENSDNKTISRAYRELARKLHPDTHPDDPDAAERFKEVTAAYEVIGDEAKRAEYDEFRRAIAGVGARGPGGGWDRGDGSTWIRSDGDNFAGGDGTTWTTFDASTWNTLDPDDLDDLFGSVLGRTPRRTTAARRGDDLEAELHLDFDDAVHGLTTEVTFKGQEGSQSFKVRVPAGVSDGQRVRLPGKGGRGSNGGPPGDLYAVVRVAPHPIFARSGKDLTVDAVITWPEAVLGTEIQVPTLDGRPVRVRVPAGTPHGRTLRVRGHGVRTTRGTGDLLVSIRLLVPDDISDEQRQAVEAVAEAFKAD
jgi:molecular chaperone DnaJ